MRSSGMDAQRLRLLAPLRRLWGPNFLLPALLIAALALRLYGIDWDNGHGFHPDERSFYLRADDMFRVLTEAPGHETWLAQWPEMRVGLPDIETALSAERSPLNPHWFPLGSALIYTLVLIRSVAELFTDWSALDLRFAGRTLAALADTASVALIFAIGRRMYGTWTGLLATALTAFAVIHVQHAHFYRPEPFTVLTSLAALWAMLRFMDTRRLRDAALLGLLVGLAMAPKVSVAPILAPLALVFLWTWKDRAGGRWTDLTVWSAVRFVPTVVLAGLLALAAFFITTPYAFLDFGTFVADIRAQAEMAREAGHWPFTWQYADTPAFWYQIRQTSVWGLGLPLGIVAWLAAPFTAWMAWRGGLTQRSDLLLLAWAVPAFVFLELFEVKFLRYVFPLMPFYVLMGARMLVWFVAWARAWRHRSPGDASVPPDDAPFSEAWHATPPTIGDDLIFDEPLFGDDAPFSEEWHATPPTGGRVVSATGRLMEPDALADRQPSRWQTVMEVTCRYTYPVSVGLLVVLVASTILYALAFSSIYSRSHTAVAAAEWINANVPPGASIINGGSFWDERIPDLGRYDVWTFPAYHPDSDRSKIPELVRRLSSSDYMVFYSNRAYGSVARLPDEYPQSSAFLRLLFAGEVGYRLERSFSSYPSLAGFRLRDNPYARAGLTAPVRTEDGGVGLERGIGLNLGYADENVIGYDHPQALVFRNVDRLSSGDIRSHIDEAVYRIEETPPLMLEPDDFKAHQSGGTWSKVFRPDGWPNRVPWLTWLLALELICLIAFPLTWWALRPLHDRGLLFSRAIGLLLVAWVAWLLVNSGAVQFSMDAIGLAMLIVAIPSAAILAVSRRELAGWLRQHWRMVLAAEALFVLAYLALALIRAANPDLWHPWRGGEKPMELAYFTAVTRSSVLPPYDPWFAGGYLNYYYWGYFILSIPTRLTGIPPVTAFNLAVPTLFALSATGAGALAYYFVKVAGGFRADTLQTDRPDSPMGRAVPWRRIARWLPGGAAVVGLISAVMVTVAGNLDGAVQLSQNISARANGMAAPLWSFDFWRSSRAIPEIPNFEPSALTPWLEARDHVDLGFHRPPRPHDGHAFCAAGIGAGVCNADRSVENWAEKHLDLGMRRADGPGGGQPLDHQLVGIPGIRAAHGRVRRCGCMADARRAQGPGGSRNRPGVDGNGGQLRGVSTIPQRHRDLRHRRRTDPLAHPVDQLSVDPRAAAAGRVGSSVGDLAESSRTPAGQGQSGFPGSGSAPVAPGGRAGWIGAGRLLLGRRVPDRWRAHGPADADVLVAGGRVARRPGVGHPVRRDRAGHACGRTGHRHRRRIHPRRRRHRPHEHPFQILPGRVAAAWCSRGVRFLARLDRIEGSAQGVPNRRQGDSRRFGRRGRCRGDGISGAGDSGAHPGPLPLDGFDDGWVGVDAGRSALRAG